MATIYELVNVPETLRDGAWQADFFKELPTANVKTINDSPVSGPDSWPYLLVQIDENGTEPLPKVLKWLSTRGIGLVVNPSKELPDAVLTYGMVWNYCQTGQIFSADIEPLDSPLSSPAETKIELEKGQKAHAGPPSETFLPDFVRTILRSFLKDNGVDKPKMLVMSTDQKSYELCFSVESLGNPENAEHSGILEALAWFLPAHYSLVLISEAGLPDFIAL